jgi:hypothetical protein
MTFELVVFAKILVNVKMQVMITRLRYGITRHIAASSRFMGTLTTFVLCNSITSTHGL